MDQTGGGVRPGRSPARAAALVALGAALAVAAASALPWAVVRRPGAERAVSGLALGGGWTLAAALAAVVFPALGLAARRPRLTGWSALPALFAAVVALGALATLSSEDVRVAVLAPRVSERIAVSTQGGLWLALGAAATLFAAAVTAALSRADAAP